MNPVVMKFGGSSVADLDALRSVASIVAARAKQGPVVVVVSAMGKTTDGLVSQAEALGPTPDARELDMLLTTGERTSMALLALAVRQQGCAAMSLTGSQCGIITTHRHGNARIVEVRPFRILDELAAGHVVVVGGFQGVSYKREVTTLGRGGSDTTAVALAASLGADCEIYSDVDGIYSADPRVVPEAKRLDALSFEEMRAMSRAGAGVLHAQAVQLAEDADISIFTRATDGRPGQSVVRRQPQPSSGVRAITGDPRVLFVSIESAEPLKRAQSLSELGFHHLCVRGQKVTGSASLTQRDDHAALREGALALADADNTVELEQRATVACVGTGIEARPEILARALEVLAAAELRVWSMHTDTLTLRFALDEDELVRATQALHAALISA